eukprot:Gregarina_sp_Poly_1__4222@NODE_2302_length_2332_cov_17_217660_g1475_i0_p3_GENE_NODE_2302_length_2332_cov_17_217660_g1475_i0NODE_2302_length_2332_cov_17_217660_g1475_i0_p3_ORF_typecomplete_len172_score21_16FH2/PF02181_23/1e32_NODE_2302_length_2332_cov_17_217660_g1475_i06771192
MRYWISTKRYPNVSDNRFFNQKISLENAELLIQFAPLPEETAAVSEYIKTGGDVTKLDRPEQFIAAMMGIPLFKQRLAAFQYVATFQDAMDELMIPLERFKNACGDVLDSQRLQKLLMAILKIGNILNQVEAVGFKAGVLSKLDDVKTTTKPIRTFPEYMVDVSCPLSFQV